MSPPRPTSTPAPVASRAARAQRIGGQRLRGRAEVDLDARRYAHRAAGAVDTDRAPPCGGNGLDVRRLRAGDHDREIAVPTESAQRTAHRRVDVAACGLGSLHGDREAFQQQRADGERPAARAVQPDELRVVAEAAAGKVDRGQLAAHDRDGVPERTRLGDGHLGRRAERAEDRGLGPPHDPPETATGGAVETAGAWTVAAVAAEDVDAEEDDAEDAEDVDAEGVLDSVGVLDSDGELDSEVSSDEEVAAAAVARARAACRSRSAARRARCALSALARCVVFADSARRLPARACCVALAAISAKTAHASAASPAATFGEQAGPAETGVASLRVDTCGLRHGPHVSSSVWHSPWSFLVSPLCRSAGLLSGCSQVARHDQAMSLEEQNAVRAPTHRILVVDDEPSIVDAVATALRYEGYEVPRGDAPAATRWPSWPSSTPDLIVLDVMLPDVDGFEVSRRLRADGLRARGPVPHRAGRDRRQGRGLAAGGDDYVTKPFSLAEVVARVRRSCNAPRAPTSTDGTLRFADVVLDADTTRGVAGRQADRADRDRVQPAALLHAEPASRAVEDPRSSTTCGTTTSTATRNVVETYVSYLRKKLNRHGPAAHPHHSAGRLHAARTRRPRCRCAPGSCSVSS